MPSFSEQKRFLSWENSPEATEAGFFRSVPSSTRLAERPHSPSLPWPAKISFSMQSFGYPEGLYHSPAALIFIMAPTRVVALSVLLTGPDFLAQSHVLWDSEPA